MFLLIQGKKKKIKHIYQVTLTSANIAFLKKHINYIYDQYKKMLKDKKKIFIKTIIFLPKKIKKLIFYRSPHVHKKSREQFEIQKHKIIIILTFSEKKNILFGFQKTLGLQEQKMLQYLILKKFNFHFFSNVHIRVKKKIFIL